MPQQLFKFEGLNRNGEPVVYRNVTMEEAMAFDKEEKEGIAERERNAKLAPALNREVSNYAKSQGITQGDLGGDFQPKRFATEEDVANDPNLKVGYPISDNTRTQLPPEDDIISSFDNMKASREDTGELESFLSSIPDPRGQVTRGIDTGVEAQPQTQQKGTLTSMLDDLDPKVAKQLLFEFHNGIIDASKLYTQIAKSKEQIAKIKQLQSKEKFTSDLASEARQEEVTQKEETLQPGRVELRDLQEAGATERANLQQQGANYRARVSAEKNVSGGVTKEDFKRENTLRKQYNALSKSFSTVRDSYSKILAVADVDKPTAAADLSSIFMFMKMLDPNSVVRESEYRTAETARGIPESIKNLYDKTAKGNILSPKQRQDFIDRAEELYKDIELNQNELKENYSNIAKSYSIDPERVTGAIILLDSAKAESPTVPEQPGGAGPQVGAVEDGYRFIGGDPSDPNSWEPVQ